MEKKTYRFIVSMDYEVELEIEAENFDEAKRAAQDMIGDGIALRDAELVSYEIEEAP